MSPVGYTEGIIMTAIDTAERKAVLRAILFFAIAAILLVLLVTTFGRAADSLKGVWTGLMLGAAINLTPLARWLKANSPVARLLDDESAREHRRMAMTAGFWATIASAIGLAFVTLDSDRIGAFDAVRVIATAAMAATLIAFATLELRAGR